MGARHWNPARNSLAPSRLTGPLRLVLPWPPSVNTYWRSIPLRGRVKVLISQEGRDYAAAVAAQIARDKPPLMLLDRLAVRLYVEAPNAAQRDIDNLPKGILDALTKANLWVDDWQIDDLHVVRGPVCRTGGRVTVTITKASLPDELRREPPAP